MEILIIIGLILLNGIFAMAEMSLVSSRKFKLENAKKKGHAGAQTALELSENPTRFLSTVQIGITLIGILLGVFSGEKLTTDTAAFFASIEFLAPFSHELGIGVVVVCITFLSIVLGELLPKRIGMTFPESIAMLLARPMQALSYITLPFVWLLTTTNDILLTMMGIRKTTDSRVTEEEIKSIIKESAEGGEIQDIEHNIVERVFELGDRRVNSLYTHRSEIVFLDANDDWETVRSKINNEKHSAYPVCENNEIENMIGIVLLKDLFAFDKDNFNLRTIKKDPVYINENTYAYKVLELFRVEKMHYGIVVDEFGSIQGIVTMDDVVDALVGDTTEIDQEEYQLTQRDENSWLVDGQYSVTDFLKYFGIQLDENIDNKFTTVAGLIIHQDAELPNVGDKFVFGKYTLEILDKDGQRIDKILVTVNQQ